MMRLLVRVAQLLLGALFGALMTFGHQATVTIAGATLPWGIVVSCLGVLGLLAGVRLLTEGRADSFWVALGIVGAVAALSLPSPGGSVIITNSVVGVIWSLAPTVLAALVVGWPNIRRTEQGTGAHPDSDTASGSDTHGHAAVAGSPE